ncbi:MAG: radical SAM protein [Planctomycetia bacterium]
MSSARAMARYAGLARRALEVRLGSTRPFKLILAVTERCDCRCEACFIWRKPKGDELTPAEVGRALAGAPWIRWLNLTGGEPFLREDFVELVEAAVGALPGLAVLDWPTTGQRTERILQATERIARLGVPRIFVSVSLEGPPTLHDRLRGRPGAFEAMCRTWAGLRSLPGVRAYLGLTLHADNEEHVPEALEAVAQRVPGTTLDDLHVNVLTTSAHYYDNQSTALRPPRGLPPLVREALRRREASAAPQDLLEAAYLRRVPEWLARGRSPVPCRSGSASVFASARGDVYPCTVYDRRLGSLREQSLAAILDGAEAAAAREVIARDACPGCWSPCEAHPTLLASLPGSLLRG